MSNNKFNLSRSVAAAALSTLATGAWATLPSHAETFPGHFADPAPLSFNLDLAEANAMDAMFGPDRGSAMSLGPIFVHSKSTRSATRADIGINVSNLFAAFGVATSSNSGDTLAIGEYTFDTRDAEIAAIATIGLSLPFSIKGNKNASGAVAFSVSGEVKNLKYNAFQSSLLTGKPQTYIAKPPVIDSGRDLRIGASVGMSW